MNTVTAPNDVSKRTHFDPYISQGSMSERQLPKAFALAFIELYTALLRKK